MRQVAIRVTAPSPEVLMTRQIDRHKDYHHRVNWPGVPLRAQTRRNLEGFGASSIIIGL